MNGSLDDLLESVDRAGKTIANAITPVGSQPGEDATGVRVSSLTEAVMGMTAALAQIADALTDIAVAIDGAAEAINGKDD